MTHPNNNGEVVANRCPDCGGLGATGSTEEWCIGWRPHAVDDVLHSHDPNRRRAFYACEKGHRWESIWFVPCPACGWRRGPVTLRLKEGV